MPNTIHRRKQLLHHCQTTSLPSLTTVSISNQSYKMIGYLQFIDVSSVDDWMDRQIKKAGQLVTAPEAMPQEDPLAELERFFDDPLVSHDECVDLIAWWGVSVLFKLAICWCLY